MIGSPAPGSASELKSIGFYNCKGPQFTDLIQMSWPVQMTSLHDVAERIGVHTVIFLITDNLPKQVNGIMASPVCVDAISTRGQDA